MAFPAKPQVAVSYSWKEELEGPNAGSVDLFCRALSEAGAQVIRDKDQLKHGECISTFMRHVGASDFLCVFLSDAYLRSPDCMYELLVAWQKSTDNPEKFRKRVKVWVMPESPSICKTEERLNYTAHWKLERERIAPLMIGNVTDGLASAEVESFRRIKQFAEHVNEMLCFFADTLSPGTADEFQQWIQSQVALTGPPMDAVSLAAVYNNTSDEIEAVLNRRPILGEFLNRATKNLIEKNGKESWRLCDDVRSRNFRLAEVLQDVSRQLPGFTGTPDDWRSLGDVAGGLVVLGIDREWVLRQREAARTTDAEFPADDEAIQVGGGRQANLLHLVSAALADGRARLEKVFGKPPLDEFRIPDVPAVQHGISADDQNHSLKLHFIQYILGPDQKINTDDKVQTEILFNRTKKVITSAIKDDHTPYIASGPILKQLAQKIRTDLKIEDLLLIHPSGDDPESLLNDNIRVLRFLGSIFDVVREKS